MLPAVFLAVFAALPFSTVHADAMENVKPAAASEEELENVELTTALEEELGNVELTTASDEELENVELTTALEEEAETEELTAAPEAAGAGYGSSFLSICDEEHYLLASDGTDVVLYDRNGAELTRFTGITEDYEMPSLISRGELLLGYRNGNYVFFSTSVLKNVAVFPMEGYAFTYNKSAVLILDKAAGILTLYDLAGNPLFCSVLDFVVQEPESWYNIYLLELDSGYLFWVKGQNGLRLTWVSRDGTVQREIMDPAVVRGLTEDYRYAAFGDNLFLCPDGELPGCILSPDGELLLPNVDFVLKEAFYNRVIPYTYYSTRPADYVIQEENGMCILYDQNFRIQGFYPNPYQADAYVFQQSAGEYVQGKTYPELGDLACTGFVYDEEGIYHPAARTEGGAYVFVDGTTVFLPFAGDEKLVQLNRNYYITETEDYLKTARRRDTGEMVVMTSVDGAISTWFSLGTEGLLVQVGGYEGDDYIITGTIYDGNGNPTYSIRKGYLRPWTKNLWHLSRGIYSGIADGEGNWVVRWKDMYSQE